MASLFRHMDRLLRRGTPLAAAVVLRRRGSAPRRAGARLYLGPDGEQGGSVGGGAIEADTLEAARRVRNTGAPEVLRFDLDADEAGEEGMVCGGSCSVLVERWDPSRAAALRAFRDAVRGGGGGALATLLPGGANAPSQTRVAFLSPDPATPQAGESLPLARDALAELLRQALAARTPRLVRAGGDADCFLEPAAHPGSVVLAGAGHVALHTARLAHDLGFATVVLDDRGEYANRNRFPFADTVRCLDSFRDCYRHLPVGPETCLVILTRGHRHDLEVLEQALGTRAGYIGMIGSRRKRDALYVELARRGFGPGDFARVHSPVGLDIGAETPEEIAVSIAAQLVQARSGRLRPRGPSPVGARDPRAP